jgi:hypothetical protein
VGTFRPDVEIGAATGELPALYDKGVFDGEIGTHGAAKVVRTRIERGRAELRDMGTASAAKVEQRRGGEVGAGRDAADDEPV